VMDRNCGAKTVRQGPRAQDIRRNRPCIFQMDL
jgi:hypothetical protein